MVDGALFTFTDFTGLTARGNCVIIELQPGDTDPYKEVAR